jgi:hypothetical protein
MSPARSTAAMPQTFEARERLRDQQRQEAGRLEAVLAAQRRLATERAKADRAIAKAELGVAAKQADVDRAVVSLVETSGLARASALLARSESELARLRAEYRRASNGKGGQDAGTSAVQA